MTPSLKIKQNQNHRPAYYDVLKNYDRRDIADALGISCGYFHHLMCGWANPSKKLNDKIIELADSLRSQEEV